MHARPVTTRKGPTRVVFGRGALSRLGLEVAAVDAARVAIVCSPRGERDATRVGAELGARLAGIVPLAREHVPSETVDAALEKAKALGADAALALGGGSAIGLAKALGVRGGLAVLAAPTTYSGSEMTPIYGITRGGKKETARDERARPRLVLYDPDLTASLPRDVTLASLWNAMAHATEGLWCTSADRATRLTAEEALRLLATSTRSLARNPDDAAAREAALEGAYLAGVVCADAGVALHHKLCHVLGGRFDAPHAKTHASLLPLMVRLHAAVSPEAAAAIARALGAIDPAEAIDALARATGAGGPLAALGVPREALAAAADDALAEAKGLGPDIARDALVGALDRAFDGEATPSSPPLRAPGDLRGPTGFGGTHQSEALEGALPHDQNAPRRAPYGLYPELFNGTPFTVKSAENRRVWMYRLRPSFSHGELTPLPPSRFAAPLEDVSPNRTRWRPAPLPEAPAEVDLLDGLVTLGGAGDETTGPAWSVHVYAANADMRDRAFADADGDLLFVPQTGTLACRTELGWLRAPPGTLLLVPRGLRFAMGLPDGPSRGWVLEVSGRGLRLPERGPIGSNGLADARHFVAPAASYEDRACPSGFELVHKIGGKLWSCRAAHSPFDVVAWHGNHAPYTYDLSLFCPMGSVKFDHPDPSILTVLTAPLDDHGRALADVVVFPGRWDVTEHSFRPPFMHRNAATEVNMVVENPGGGSGYDPGCTFLTPLLTAHGVSARTYEQIAALPADHVEPPFRIPDSSLWMMFESALPFRRTAWARETPLVDPTFLALFEGLGSHFDPSRRA